MNTFYKIKELASLLSKDYFTKDQYIIIIGCDCACDKVFSYTVGDFFGVLSLITEYIERLEKFNPPGLSKYDFLTMIRKSMEEDDKYDQTS